MIKYQEYQDKDFVILKEMILKLYKEDSEGQGINENKIRRTVNESIKNPQKLRIIFIQINEEIIGYAIIVFYWSNEFGGNIVNIDELYIEQQFRGKGIATNFFKDIQKMFSDIIALQLETTPSNHRVMEYYRRIGFVTTSNTHMIYIFKNK